MGDSFLRQTEKARAIASEKKWTLIDLPPDKGISAFREKNLNEGALGIFLKKVEDGQIPVPCCLIVEKLDRFSRTDVDVILPKFLSLLKSGVEVFSVIENVHYTKESLKKDPVTTIMQMLMAFYGANAYSVALKDRVGAAKRRQTERAMKGEVTKLPKAPTFYSWDKQQQKYYANEKAATVKQIFEMYSDGISSMQQIANRLNTDGVSTFGNGKRWQQGHVKSILESPYVIGEYKGVKNVLPKCIDEELYNAVQTLLKRHKKRAGRTAPFINIFRGLVHCKCCGKRSSIYESTGNHHIYLYYRCQGRFEKIDNKPICKETLLLRLDKMEPMLFAVVLRSTPEILLGAKNVKNQKTINAYTTDIAKLDIAIDKAMVMMDDPDMPLEQIKNKLGKLQKDKKALIEKLREAQAVYALSTNIPKAFEDMKSILKGDDMVALDDAVKSIIEQLKNVETRKKLALLLPTVVERIDVDYERAEVFVKLVSDGTLKFLVD